ncbi:hypothetical protein [Pontibacter arcticus]|uniref:Curlin associated repeat-containing protein n=1 Tax=Pontibacter arcticus TaxID=2080288 RepID=A0A364RH86_9BACT|nr:hypothetical protein DP923_00930 [Pontibacter arcticus]
MPGSTKNRDSFYCNEPYEISYSSEVSITQDGDSNSAIQSQQNGSYNIATIQQQGNCNTATQHQTGNNNTATVTQGN